MSLGAILLALAGTLLSALGGYVLGLFSRRRGQRRLELDAQKQIGDALEKVLRRLEVEDGMARAVDPLADGGRTALASVLGRIQAHGGYSAVALSDDHGLVLAGCGPDEVLELMAVEAAAFGTTADHVGGGRQALLQSRPDKRWTLHRYFTVGTNRLCVSARRQGGTPRIDALDGTLGAFERVLVTSVGSAA